MTQIAMLYRKKGTQMLCMVIIFLNSIHVCINLNITVSEKSKKHLIYSCFFLQKSKFNTSSWCGLLGETRSFQHPLNKWKFKHEMPKFVYFKLKLLEAYSHSDDQNANRLFFRLICGSCRIAACLALCLTCRRFCGFHFFVDVCIFTQILN